MILYEALRSARNSAASGHRGTGGKKRGAELLTGGRRQEAPHRTAPLSDGHSWPGSQKYGGQQHGGQHHKSLYQHHDGQHHDGQLVYLPG